MESALNKIIMFFKKTCENILYVFLNILNKTKEEESMKNNMPISDIEYFDTLINFLLDNSNNHSSINFCTRLEELYLNSVNSFNAERKLNGQEPYVPHPNFLLELQYADIVWVRNMISNNFLQIIYDNTSFYKIFIKYKLNEAENNNIQDTDYIMNIFNNYCHNMMIFPKLPIYCTEVFKENRYLIFTFIHYGKHKELKNKELNVNDEHFY